MELVSIVAPDFVIAVINTFTEVDPLYEATIDGIEVWAVENVTLSEEELVKVTSPVSIVILSKPAIYDPT